MRRLALTLVVCGIVACSPGEKASVAATAKWRPLAPSTLART